jgi:glycosyltransferase involved in cell wall biosynthesis
MAQAAAADPARTGDGWGCRMMRVALISEHASPLAWLGGADAGGQNVYVGQVARQLAARGHQVDVFTRLDQRDLPRVVRLSDGVRVVNLPCGPPTKIPKEALLPHMAEFADSLCDFAAREKRYDLAHANFFMSALAASQLRRELGVPYVVTFHALGRVRRQHQGPADGFPSERVEIEDGIVAQADRIIAECPQDADDLTQLYGADRCRLAVVPCGVDLDELKPAPRLAARRVLGWDPHESIVLQLGRLVPRKGIDNVIAAVAVLRRRYGLLCRLAIVGGDLRVPDARRTPEIARLSGLANQLGVSEQITFVGSRDRHELAACYCAADVFVTTPWYEPFGITPLEAMACGVPVIGSAVGGIKMSVADGETGYLVPPRDPSALAERLAELLLRPQLRAAMGQAGRRRVAQLFTWQRVAGALEHVYLEVIRFKREMRGAEPHVRLPSVSPPVKNTWSEVLTRVGSP